MEDRSGCLEFPSMGTDDLNDALRAFIDDFLHNRGGVLRGIPIKDLIEYAADRVENRLLPLPGDDSGCLIYSFRIPGVSGQIEGLLVLRQKEEGPFLASH